MSDDGRNVELEDVVDAAIEARLFKVHTSLPGRIKRYDASKQLADVEICITPTLLLDDGEEREQVLGVVTNVPIKWLSGGGYFMAFPLNEGDGVELTFQQFSIDEWIEKGAVRIVKDLRMHHLSDATAYPGLRAQPDKLTSASASKLVIGKDGDASMQITIDGTTIKLSDNATNFVALANLVHDELVKIAAAFSSFVPGSGGASFGSPYTTAGQVAAQKVKAE